MVRVIAQKVFDAAMLDTSTFLTPACMADFGLEDGDFQGKFGALQKAARGGATAEDFDAALGSGEKLTELVAKYGSNIVFGKTVWDKLDEFK